MCEFTCTCRYTQRPTEAVVCSCLSPLTPVSQGLSPSLGFLWRVECQQAATTLLYSLSGVTGMCMALIGYLVCYPGPEIQSLVFTTAHWALLTRTVLHPKSSFSVSQKSDSASTREAEAGKSL